jgi:hypothetical protein
MESGILDMSKNFRLKVTIFPSLLTTRIPSAVDSRVAARREREFSSSSTMSGAIMAAKEQLIICLILINIVSVEPVGSRNKKYFWRDISRQS